MRSAFILLLFYIISPLYSQTTHDVIVTSEENLRNLFNWSGAIYVTNMDNLYEGVKGNPYLFNEWKPGNIYLSDNKLIKNVNIKYDIYADNLFYLNSSSGDSLIINRAMIDKFEIIDEAPGEIYVMEKMSLKPEKSDKDKFVRILYSGKSKFILRYVKMLIKATYKGPYPTGNRYDEFCDSKQYYFLSDEGTITKVKLNKKSVIKLLSDKEKEIKAFVNEQGLAMDNERNVAKVFEYYDSLTH